MKALPRIAMLALASALCAEARSGAAEHPHDHAHEHEAAPAAVAPDAGPGRSELEHVPPDPPGTTVGELSHREMIRVMQMDDRDPFALVVVDRFEASRSDGYTSTAADVYARYGTDFDRLWVKFEGARTAGRTDDARFEALWDHVASRWWSLQSGLRHDAGRGPSRDWLAVGIQGLAPYFFELEATAYVGEQGRTALRFETEVDVLLTQRLILQPLIGVEAFGKSDPARGIGSGLSQAELGLRLRYEFRREFAPYAGVAWERRFGQTATFARAAGEEASDLRAVAGLRLWF